LVDNLIKLPMQVQVLRLLLFVLIGFLRGQPINLDMQPVFQTISRNQDTPGRPEPAEICRSLSLNLL